MTETRLAPVNPFSPDRNCTICHGRGKVWDGFHAINCLCTTNNVVATDWCMNCKLPLWKIPGIEKWVHMDTGDRNCRLVGRPLTCVCDRGWQCDLCWLRDVNGGRR